MEIYLDNSATTAVTEKVRDIVCKVMYEDYGNPSSMHRVGMRAENYIKEAAKIIAASMKVEPKELVFTSGGTEANNMALIGSAMANRRRGKHIITTNIEHPSVHEPIAYLEEQGFTISYAPVDETGKIIKDALYNLVKEDTVLVSIMYVNNEIGSVQEIKTLSEELKKRNPQIVFHVDGIQAFGKYRIHPKKEGIDLLSISGHKIHGPKGTGVLYISDKTRVTPILFGGGHQRGLRSGTENVPGVAGLGQAVEELYEHFDQKIDHMYGLKQGMIRGLASIEGVKINGLPQDITKEYEMEELRKTAPHIVSASFEGVRSEVLLHSLEDKGIYVSAGSACSSHHPMTKGTLTAIGLDKKHLESTIRFSFCEKTTMEEVDFTIEQIKALLPMLRRFTRK